MIATEIESPENKESKKANLLNNNKTKIDNKDSSSFAKNRLVIYESIKNKLKNNNNTNNLYNNYNNTKKSKTNNEKYGNNLNKTFTGKNNSILTSANQKSNKKEKKLAQYAATINNYYNNKYPLSNSEFKGFSNEYSKNYFDKINKKQISTQDNTNFRLSSNKNILNSNKNQTIYKPKNGGNKENSHLNISTSTIKNNYKDKIRQYSVNNNKKLSTKNISTDNILNTRGEIKEIKNKKDKVLKIFKNNKNISSKEEAFYILSISPILRLNEQLIFSRATKNIRNVLSINTILKNHNIFLNAKANELMQEIELCEKRIKTPFTASKIADITLNFITSLDEQEFKDFDILETNKEEIKTYYIYIKLLHILFNISYDSNMEGKKLKNNLFEKVKERGFKHLRDYLYHIYIAKKEDIKIVTKIEIINKEIIKKSPDLLSYQENMKICRFTAFTFYLIKEIINYANNIKDMCELKFRALHLLDIVMEKIEKLENKNNKIKKKNKNKL